MTDIKAIEEIRARRAQQYAFVGGHAASLADVDVLLGEIERLRLELAIHDPRSGYPPKEPKSDAGPYWGNDGGSHD